MPRVLITGMSGTGKSTVLSELSRRGHRTVDTDDDGWSEQVDSGGAIEQLWVEPRIAELLDGESSLVVSGCAANQGHFYDRFDTVVLLSAPLEVMLARIQTRAGNSFGKSEGDRDRILRDLQDVEPLLRATSTVEIRTDRSLEEVVDAVESYT